MPDPTEINEEPQNEFQKVVAAQDASIEAFLALKEELDHMNALGSKVLQRKHVALKPFHRGEVQHLASPAVARPSCQTLDRIEPVSRSRRASLPRREEWVQHLHAETLEVGHVSGHYGELVHLCRRSNHRVLVQRV